MQDKEDFITEDQLKFNKSIISTVENNLSLLNTVFQPKNLNSHAVMLYAPLWTSELKVFCKYHPESLLEDAGSWGSAKRSRTLYDLHRKVILISRQVKCDKCLEPYKSHDDHVLSCLPNTMFPPFILTHKEGITTQAADLIWNCASNGEFIKLLFACSIDWP